MAGRNLTYNFKCDGRLCHIARAYGIAVHGGHRGRRLGAQCNHVFGEYAAERLVEGHNLGWQRSRVGQHPLQCFGDRH